LTAWHAARVQSSIIKLLSRHPVTLSKATRNVALWTIKFI